MPRLPKRATEVFEEVLSLWEQQEKYAIAEHHPFNQLPKLKELSEDVREYRRRFYGK